MVFFPKRYFLWLVAHGWFSLLYIGDGCDCRGIGHAGSVFSRLLGLLAPFETLSRSGMGLLYYGQNFLIYPSAFPAGARESEFPTSLSSFCSDWHVRPAPLLWGWFTLFNGQTSPSQPIFRFRTRTLSSRRRTMSKSGRSCCFSGTC